MYSILHISDLHRASNEPFTNDEIVSSLHADIERFESESPPIRRPDAIVVSGDLVQGLPLESTSYPDALITQYDVAFDLLVRLCDSVLGGDRSKLIMVPGNHDVDFNKSVAAMSLLNTRPRDIKGLLFSGAAENPHRWSWSHGKIFRVASAVVYEERFHYYANTFRRFYDGAALAYPVDPGNYSNLFELDDGRIVVAAFNSCSGNDCFNYVGSIPTAEVAKSHLTIIGSGKPYRLKMAVWHHDVDGPPQRSDYMDREVVKLMIDRGFRLGLHGHQHKANATPEWVYTASRTSMAVISAGSLCAGSRDVPRGVSREYNVVEIAPDYLSARIHVREAKVANIFSAGRFIASGGASFESVEWAPETSDRRYAFAAVSVDHRVALETAEKLLSEGMPRDAAMQLAALPDLRQYGKQLLLRALSEGEDWDGLIRHFPFPVTADEATLIVSALCKRGRFEEARGILASPETTRVLSSASIAVLANMINAEDRMSR